MSSGRTHARAHSQEAYSWDSAQVCVNPKSVLLLFLLFSARIVFFSTFLPQTFLLESLTWDPDVKSR